MKSNVLLLVSVYPHYRKQLYEKLGKLVELTVTSLPLSRYNLEPPGESPYVHVVRTKAVDWLYRLIRIQIIPREMILALTNSWDAVIAFYSWRLPHRFLVFLFFRIFRPSTRWIWTGHIFGRRRNIFMRVSARFFLNRASATLTYTSRIENELRRIGISTNVMAFNNTSISLHDIVVLPWNHMQNGLNLIFVGRVQDRKHLDRLCKAVDVMPYLRARIIGPGSDKVSTNLTESAAKRVELYGPMYSNQLTKHFEWAHAVACPGHLGLMVVTAGQFGRPIIVHSSGPHAPEIQIAVDADQFFVDWNDTSELSKLFDMLLNDEGRLKVKGDQLQRIVKESYTVETSIQRFVKALGQDSIYDGI